MRSAAAALVLVLLVGACSSSSDDDASTAGDGAATTTTAVVAGDAPVDPSADPGDVGTGPVAGDGTTGTVDDPAGDLDGDGGGDGDQPVVEGVCTLLPPGSVVEGLGELPTGVPGGDDRRQVCTLTAGPSGAIGVTLGLEEGDRFDDKVAASQDALGVDGESVDGVGDRARFFFSDAEIPEGVGGIVVASGDHTIDITLQGLGETELRAAAVALATLAAGNL